MKKYPLLYVFITCITILMLLDFVFSNKEFSYLENRKLSTRPKFTMKSYFNNEFAAKYEKYINDQFVFRDQWITMKSISEKAFGKIENNGIVYGKDGYMFEKVDRLDEERIINNLNAIKLMAEKLDMPVSVIISPNSSGIYTDKIPKGNLFLPQQDMISKFYSVLDNTNNINLIDKFNEEKNKYIFYKNDHHWTTYGAYLAYYEFIKNLGMEPIDLGILNKHEVDGFYGTYFSKSKDFTAKPDTLTYYDISNVKMIIGEEVYDSLYDFNKLKEIDKYSMFIRGNNPLVVVKNEELKNNKKLLVIKDSYANSMIPFLSQNYEEIHVIDLRHFGHKISNYLKENKFDNILVIYNFNTFISDINVVKMKY